MNGIVLFRKVKRCHKLFRCSGFLAVQDLKS